MDIMKADGKKVRREELLRKVHKQLGARIVADPFFEAPKGQSMMAGRFHIPNYKLVWIHHLVLVDVIPPGAIDTLQLSLIKDK